MKKLLPVMFAVIALLFVFGGVFAAKKFMAKPVSTPEPTKRPKLSLPANTIPVETRPYVTLKPTASREIVLTLHNQPKKALSADLEIKKRQQ